MANNVEVNNIEANKFREILHNLERRDLAILYNTLQLANDEVAQRQYMREQRPTKPDGTLYNAYCARVLVEDPVDYVQEEIWKRMNYKDTATVEETYYTFFYCYMHDCGWIISGRHNYVPHGYQHEHAHNCDYSDWHNQGIIVTNGEGGIDIVEEVRIDYSRFCGGFVFSLYQDTLTDETGKYLDMDEHPELKEWITQNTTF